jgi:uncharacterized membrane protein
MIVTIIIIITIIIVDNGKYGKTPTIATKTKIFCAFSRIVTGDNQFCRIRTITYINKVQYISPMKSYVVVHFYC